MCCQPSMPISKIVVTREPTFHRPPISRLWGDLPTDFDLTIPCYSSLWLPLIIQTPCLSAARLPLYNLQSSHQDGPNTKLQQVDVPLSPIYRRIYLTVAHRSHLLLQPFNKGVNLRPSSHAPPPATIRRKATILPKIQRRARPTRQPPVASGAARPKPVPPRWYGKRMAIPRREQDKCSSTEATQAR